MSSRPPSYTAIPISSQSTRPAQVSTSLISRSQTNYGAVESERSKDDKDESSAIPALSAFIVILMVIIGALVIVLVSYRVLPPLSNGPASALSISPLAPVATVTATSSWMVWMVYYQKFNSSICSKPLSQGKLYLESWAEAPTEEVKIGVTSPCEIYAIDLHAGPECKGDGEGRDCTTMFSSLQVYTNLTDCREKRRIHDGLYKFGLGLSKFGSSYALEKEGIHSGTDLVPREDGFDWSWSAERARKEEEST